jgi:hypothetical protein
MEDDIKILKVEYLSNHCIKTSLGEMKGKLRGNLECGSAQSSLFI